MRALSGAATALIVLAATTVIVIGLVLAVFGANDNQQAVSQVGPAYIAGTPTCRYNLTVVLNNPGSTAPVIQAVSVNNVLVRVISILPSPALSPGKVQTVTISFTAPTLKLQPGTTVNVQISLSNGQVVQGEAVYLAGPVGSSVLAIKGFLLSGYLSNGVNGYILLVTLANLCSTPVEIKNVSINGVPLTIYNIYPSGQIEPNTQITLTIYLTPPASHPLNLLPSQKVTVQLSLSNGDVIQFDVSYVGP
ncbi:MAG: hypothetical protein ACP5HQ_08965 [Thermoprotei archaeon]